MKRKPVDRMNNVEFLEWLCEHSRHGALAQIFILDAVAKFADAVAESSIEDYPDNHMVHPSAWIGVAKEIKQKMEDRHG
jgi:hypothetical protein